MQRALVSLILLALLVPTVAAQEPQQELGNSILDFRVTPLDGTQATIDSIPGEATLRLRIEDRSWDGVPPPQLGGGSSGAQPHRYSFQVETFVVDNGWQIATIPGFQMNSGQSRDVNVQFQLTPAATHAFYPIRLNISMEAVMCCGETHQVIDLIGHSPGLSTFGALAAGGFRAAGPNEVVNYEVEITNFALEDKAFRMEVANNPCGLRVTTASAFLPSMETDRFPVVLETPAEKPFYASESCQVSIRVFPEGEEGRQVLVPLMVQIQGGYVDPGWIFTFIYIAVPLVLLILFLAWRKRRIEEEILGKPQKPWTIPAEQIYLAELQEKDPRAAYVVRNFLMEDEYRSSLDWYHAYKAATKGERSKERLILKQEHKLERYERKRTRVLARPEKKADKFALKLQKKLDRKDRKAHRKEMRKWRKSCKKMDAKNQKVHEKLHGVWEKQKKRAEKKGLEVPPEPVLAEPDYPDEPVRNETPLAEHKWARKAIRYQDRMERREARLQAKYDKGHAKHLAKARKKAQKIARKLDDPDFINEHALLKGADSE